MSDRLGISLFTFGRTTFDACSEFFSIVSVCVSVFDLLSAVYCEPVVTIHPGNSERCIQRVASIVLLTVPISPDYISKSVVHINVPSDTVNDIRPRPFLSLYIW